MADETLTLEQLAEKVKLQEAEQAIRQTILDTIKETIDAEALSAEQKGKDIADLQSQYDLQKQQLNLLIQEVANKVKSGKLAGEALKDETARLAAMEKGLRLEEQKIEVKRKAQKDDDEADKKRKDSLKNLESEFSGMILKFTGIGDAWRNGFLGTFADAIESGNSMGDAFKKIGETLKKQFSFKNILGSMVGNIIQQTTMAVKAVDEAQSNFVKTTGTVMTSEDKKMVSEISEEQHKYGITISENTANLGKLRSQVSGFRNLTAETQGAVLEATNQFEALGIATEDSAKFMNFATKAMGMSETAAIDMQKKVFGLSKEVSASASELMQQMQQMEGDLAQFGDNMGQEFTNLALIADKTGISMEKLVGIAKKFDTFRGAASAVGKLNTMLGRNMIDMKKIVGLPFSEKIKYIAEQVEKSGQSFETMGRHRKKAFAAAMETDVATMMKIVTGEADKQEKKFAELGVTNEDMNKSAAAATPIFRMLKAAMEKFVVALEPVINIIRAIVTWFAELNPETRKTIGIVMLVIGALVILGKIVPGIVALFTAFTASAAAAAAPAALVGKAFTFMGGLLAGSLPLFVKAAIGLGLLGAAMGLVALAVIGLVYAFREIVGMFSDLGEFVAAMATLAGTMLLMVVAGASALVGLVLFSAGLLVFAGALLLIKTEDLQAISALFTAIAATPTPPWTSWGEGLAVFANAVDKNMKHILGPLNNLMFTMGLLDMFGSGEGVKASVKLFTAISEVDDSSIKGIEETRKLVTELRLAAENDTAEAMEKLLRGVQEAFNKKQEITPIVVKIGEYELFKIMDKKADKDINPMKNGFFSSL